MQALTRRLHHYSPVLERRLRYWTQGQIFFRKLQALPYLPAAHILIAFNWLIASAPADILHYFQDTLDYIRR